MNPSNMTKVLLIEDNPGDIRLIREMLSEERDIVFNVESADCLSTGLARLAAGGIDIVMLDLGLPDSSGLNTFNRVYAQTPETPIVVLTGLGDADVAIRAVQAGAQDYLMKNELYGNLLVRCARYAIERKRTEQELKETEQKFRNLLENIPNIAVQGYTPDGTVHYWNSANERVYGYTAKEVIGKNIVDLIIPPEMRSDVQEIIRHGAQTGEMPPASEISLLRKDGSHVSVLSSHAVVKQQNKEPELFCIDVDLTETKMLEARLRQAQKMEAIGTLAGGIAHDFNNILASMLGYAEVASLDLADEDKAKEMLKRVIIGGKRAKDLVKQILTFSRQQDQERIPMKISHILVEALRLLKATLPSTIEIRQNVVGYTEIVKADPTRIHQIMMNLCTNAAHAMREDGGVLAVSVANVALDSGFVAEHPGLNVGPYAEITVSDTGHGMAPEVMERIFDPYFTTKEKGVGTGMGLAVVHGIVKSHGGAITAESKPGKGSSFYVYLPVIQEAEKKPETGDNAPLPTGHARILFIDDEPTLADIGKQALEHLGYDVVAKTSSIEALELFRTKPEQFDLVITDATMPKMTGDRLARELMKIRSDIPIIICTGYSERITEEKTKKMGIKAFAMKPLTIRELALKVRETLESDMSDMSDMGGRP